MRIKRVLVLLICLVVIAQAQQQKPKNVSKTDFQTIRIDFVKYDKDKRLIWLSLGNYSRWNITFDIAYGHIDNPTPKQKNGVTVRPQYLVEDNKINDQGFLVPHYRKVNEDGRIETDKVEPIHPPVPYVGWGDTSELWTLKSGNKVYFIVPFEHLARNCRLYLDIKYPWNDDLIHRVYYDGNRLPDEVQKLIK